MKILRCDKLLVFNIIIILILQIINYNWWYYKLQIILNYFFYENVVS